jgi:tartrate-resistant acid phosphatase type 5
MSRIRIPLILALLVLSQLVSLSQGSISFIAIGDWGRQGKHHQLEVAEQMGSWGSENNLSFVVTLGDNIYENGVSSIDDPLWLSTFENIYTASSLHVPWYAALGNHDYHGSVPAQIEYSDVSTRWRMPSRFYSFVRNIDSTSSALFVILDTNPLCKSDGESRDQFKEDISKFDNSIQLKWLDSTLANTPAKWKFVFGHHPVFSGGYHGGVEEMQEFLEPVFEKYKIDAYFCGHDHDMQYLKKNGVNYFVSGAGSKTRECEDTEFTYFYASKTSGFLGLDLSADELKAVFISNSGKVLYNTSLTKN